MVLMAFDGGIFFITFAAFAKNPLSAQISKKVYNDQPLGILALGKIGDGYGSLVSMVSMVKYLGGVLWYLG